MRDPTVLFDLGNVLVRLDLERGLRRLLQLGHRSGEPPRAGAVYFSERALAFNRGEVGTGAFLTELARQLEAHGASPEAVAAAWCDIFDPWPEMEALAEEVLEAGHRAYLCSNTDPIHFEFLRARMPVLGRLTGLHLSYEAGATKPDPEYFRRALGRFRLAAERCVFVDDRPEHVAAAQSVGISAVQHCGDVGEVRAALRERGVRLGS